jgi:hypothetical protein
MDGGELNDDGKEGGKLHPPHGFPDSQSHSS